MFKTKGSNLLNIYLITMLGSSITTVISFLLIETTFKNIKYLALSLSVRTFAFILFSYLTPSLINRFGEKKSLFFSQLFGLIALVVLYFGISNTNFLLVVVGLILTGFPGNVTTTSIIVCLKDLYNHSDEFRKYSARREFIAGFTLAFAGLISPTLLKLSKIEWVLLFDGLTYLLACYFLFNFQFPNHKQIEKTILPPIKYFFENDVLKFILGICGSMMLMATLPLIAGSSSLQNSLSFHSALFNHFWFIEGSSIMVASMLYLHLRSKKYIFSFFYFNAIFLFLTQFVHLSYIQFLLICFIPICYSIIFFENRDNLIIKAGTDKGKISSFAAISVLVRSFFGVISPPIIIYLFTHFSALECSLLLLFIQSCLFLFLKSKIW